MVKLDRGQRGAVDDALLVCGHVQHRQGVLQVASAAVEARATGQVGERSRCACHQAIRFVARSQPQHSLTRAIVNTSALLHAGSGPGAENTGRWACTGRSPGRTSRGKNRQSRLSWGWASGVRWDVLSTLLSVLRPLVNHFDRAQVPIRLYYSLVTLTSAQRCATMYWPDMCRDSTEVSRCAAMQPSFSISMAR